MRKLVAIVGNIKMTAAILALVMTSIIGSIAIVSVAIYANLHSEAIAESRPQQQANLAMAATILESRISGSVLTWTPEGAIEKFQSFALPAEMRQQLQSTGVPERDNQIINSVTRVTRQDASIYVVDEAGGALVSETTSLTDADGNGLVDMVLPAGSPAHAAITAGEAFVGEMEVDGAPYYAALQPITGAKGEVIGAIFVGTPMAVVEASANGVLGLILMVGGAVTAALSIIGWVLSRIITRPIPTLAGSMEAIAEGNYDTDVPYTGWGNEVGAMARAVEVFRQNGLRVSQMTEAEAARIIAEQANRQQMMTELQNAFGVVVDAAVTGNFTRQVEVEFPDPELNALAHGINSLVTTFNRGVTEIGGVLAALANTDLTHRMEGDYEGAFATLKTNANAVVDKLTEVMGQLRQTSGSLKTATSEILAGANDLSERTTKQAATIEETSAAMEQLAATVLKNAERAMDASMNAVQVTRTAEEGGEVMDAANAAMERITQSSAKISNIIGMIDDIAFQTNLLALNASVEAARAGDAGKGFAVVAVEVRRLAQSAAQASSEVKALIEQSAGEVSSGSNLVGVAAGKLKGMLEAVRGNNGLLESIAGESREQASAIEEMTVAVRIMDEMTQHNAALVEETNAAIEQTEAQANQLDRIVELFQLSRPQTRPDADRTAGALLPEVSLPRRRPASRQSRGNAAVSPDWNEF